MKEPKSFRLTAHAIALLQAMAEQQGVSRTAILEMLIREAARKRAVRSEAHG